MTIQKIRANHVIDFAAEELKKYLRMMMPEAGDFEIVFNPEAKDGFRLGLLEDFGLPNEADDPVLDDIVHIDTDEKGGVLAGSNPRSVLFAVYRFLRLNGCRWLYPGVDGDFVPVKDIAPQSYHWKASHRFRGHCNEGAESQQCMLETIDFYAKQELNVYMIEFDIPIYYYDSYYTHSMNTANRAPEPVSFQQVLQWKRQCETEIAKRGLQFHDMGHGWTAEPFGIPSTLGWKKGEFNLSDEQQSYLAQLNGVRGLYKGVAINTNLCMSNPKVRSIMADGIVSYAESHRNVDYLHVWLADGNRNHCECEECQKAVPSDFYLMIMNEVDEKLTAKGLDTRVVFIAYVDTLFAPKTVTIANPKRFSLLYAPITRSYCSSITEESVVPQAPEYARNQWQSPKSAEENLAFLKSWKKNWNGPCFSYEYHFWKHQHRDPSGMYIAKRVYEDIRSLNIMGLDGFVEDGSQRSFFPNGFAIYVYAETLLNRDITWDALVEDYFSHIYGKDWKEALSILQRISNAFDYPYVAGEAAKYPEISPWYDPERVSRLEAIHDLTAEERNLASNHLACETRPQTVSWRMLLRHAEYCDGVAEVLKLKAAGQNFKAVEVAKKFIDDFGKYEIELERYFDHFQSMKFVDQLVVKPVSILFN